MPRSATREDLPLLDGKDLPAIRERESEWLTAQAERPGLPSAAAVALDPYRWQLVRFALWAAPVDDFEEPPSVTRYEVLHLSAPRRAQLG